MNDGIFPLKDRQPQKKKTTGTLRSFVLTVTCNNRRTNVQFFFLEVKPNRAAIAVKS